MQRLLIASQAWPPGQTTGKIVAYSLHRWHLRPHPLGYLLPLIPEGQTLCQPMPTGCHRIPPALTMLHHTSESMLSDLYCWDLNDSSGGDAPDLMFTILSESFTLNSCVFLDSQSTGNVSINHMLLQNICTTLSPSLYTRTAVPIFWAHVLQSQFTREHPLSLNHCTSLPGGYGHRH